MTPAATSIAAKWWGNSLTIQGALLSAASAMLPAVGALVGLDVNGDTVRQIGEQTVTVVQAVGGIAGMVMTNAGRARAIRPLARRDVLLKV